MTLKKLFSAALVGGFSAGIIAAILQLWLNQPLIEAAELLEVGGDHTGHDHAHDHGNHLSRHVLTFAANIITFTGFALVLAALMELLQPKVTMPAVANGIIWGVVGYAMTIMAPTLGLPAELPTTPHTDLVARQIWWVAAAVCMGAALWLACLAPLPIWRIAPAIIIAIAPHIYGAPHIIGDSPVPAQIAALFASRSLTISLIAWVVLGIAVAKIRESFE